MTDLIEITRNLYLIPLDMELTGFTSFIGSWLYIDKKTFLVDVGPSGTVKRLFDILEKAHIHTLDAILLTHIHLDHAGAVGEVSSRFPKTPVVCHRSAIKHLVAPENLWKGSLKILGDTARAYGPVRPVRQELLVDADSFDEPTITAIPTPGHAPHHVSYLIDTVLFAGEAGGVFFDPSGKPISNEGYLRPATPPIFFMETMLESIDAIIDLEYDIYCYGHFGATRNGPQLLKDHKQQLFLWKKTIEEQVAIGFQSNDDLEKRCMSALFAADPLLSGWNRMTQAHQERERFFLRNSIRGFIGYIQG